MARVHVALSQPDSDRQLCLTINPARFIPRPWQSIPTLMNDMSLAWGWRGQGCHGQGQQNNRRLHPWSFRSKIQETDEEGRSFDKKYSLLLWTSFIISLSVEKSNNPTFLPCWELGLPKTSPS
jgi:hypothetical protein